MRKTPAPLQRPSSPRQGGPTEADAGLPRRLEKTGLAAAKSASGAEADMIRARPAPSCLLCGREGRILYHNVRDRNLFVPGSWSFRVCRDCDFA
jgi:hypothetical protein